MDTTAFVFGLIGMTFGIMAWEKVTGLKKEVEEMKKKLEKPENK